MSLTTLILAVLFFCEFYVLKNRARGCVDKHFVVAGVGVEGGGNSVGVPVEIGLAGVVGLDIFFTEGDCARLIAVERVADIIDVSKRTWL